MESSTDTYACPKCGAHVPRYAPACPACGVRMLWDSDLYPPDQHPESTAPGSPVPPLRLGDIFDWTFKLTGRIFTRSAVIVLMLFVPVSILLIVGSREFYGTIGEMMPGPGKVEPKGLGDFYQMFQAMAVFGTAIFFAFLANTGAELALTILTAGELLGVRIGWKDALTETFSLRYLRGLGVILLQALTAMGLFVLPFLALALGKAGVVLTLLSFPAMGCVVAFLLIRWSMAFTVIGCEDSGVTRAFGRSWFLVEGTWWRVLGILILFSILANFAITLLTTPLSLVGMWDFYREYFKMLGALKEGQPDPSVMAKMIGSMGTGIGVSIALSMTLLALIKPVYTTVLYFDLRARKWPLEQSHDFTEFLTSPVSEEPIHPDNEPPHGS